MATIGDLVVRLGADSTKFRSGLQSAQSSLSKFASAAKSAMVPFAAGLAAAAGSVYLLASRIQRLADVSDQAIKTGLSGEFVQQLGYAADQSGVSLDTLTQSVKKLTVTIGKGDVKPFQAIGISMKELQSMSPDEQFLKVAEAIGKLPTAAERASAAVKIFGKSGVEMTGLFSGGLDDVNKLMKEAKDLGIGISNEDLALIARADDAIQRMKASFGALADKATVAFAPILTDIADKVTAWMVPLNRFTDKFNELPDKGKFLSDVIETSFTIAMETIKTGWDDMLRSLLKQTWTAAKDMHDMLTPTGWALRGLRGLGIPGLAAAVGDGGGQENKLQAAQARMQGLMQQLNAGGREGPMVGPQQPGPKGNGDIAGMLQHFGDKMAGPIAEAKMAGLGLFGKAKMDLAWLGDVVTSAFTGDPKEKTKLEPALAGAMQKGSSEAYSTLVQNMMRNGSNDPNVKATEKQTKELVKAFKQNKPVFSVIDDFLGGLI